MELPKDEAVAALVDLGVSDEDARRALLRYNNDVARAADFIFSGQLGAEEDFSGQHEPPSNNQIDLLTQGFREDDNPTPDWQTWPKESTMNQSASTADVPLIDITASSPENEPSETSGSIVMEDRLRPPVDPAKREVTRVADNKSYDMSRWALVPASNDHNERSSDGLDEESDQSGGISYGASSAWSCAPGLSCANPDFASLASFLQALFDVKEVRKAILSYRPTLDEWGNPADYHRGSGEVIAESDALLTHGADAKQFGLLYELQKLFAYMTLTRRKYIDCSHVAAALCLKVALRYTSADQDKWAKIFTTFTSMLASIRKSVNGDAEEEQTDLDQNKDDFPFYECFYGEVCSEKISLSPDSESEDKDDDSDSESAPEIEEFAYLTVPISAPTRNLHDAFRDLMFMQHAKTLRVYLFSQLPEVLLINVDKSFSPEALYKAHSDPWHSPSVPAPFEHLLVLYVDRYMMQNHTVIFDRRKMVAQWQRELQDTRKRYARLQGGKNVKSGSIMNGIRQYFQNKADTMMHAPIPANMDLEDIDILADILEEYSFRYARRIRGDLEAKIEDLEATIESAFDTPEFCQTPYDLRAVFTRDTYGYQTSHTVYSRASSDQGAGWTQYTEGHVRNVTEDYVLKNPMNNVKIGGVYCLLYCKRGDRISHTQITDNIPESLKEFVMEDNNTIDWNAHTLATHRDDGESVASTLSLSSLHYDDSEALPYPFSKSPSDGTLATADDTDVTCVPSLVQKVYAKSQSMARDDYRILERFDIFLGRVGNFEALSYLLDQYAFSEADDEDPDVDPRAASDPQLQPLIETYRMYLAISETFLLGMEYMMQADFWVAIRFFLRAQDREKQWLDAWDVPEGIEDVAAVRRSDIFGQYALACFKVIQHQAYQNACDPLHVDEGLVDALELARQAHHILDNEYSNGANRLEYRTALDNARELWLQFSDQKEAQLTTDQQQKLREVVMLYLDAGVADAPDDRALFSGSQWLIDREEEYAKTATQLLWERYQTLQIGLRDRYTI